MIFVFFNDKLISCDTFLPMAFELRGKTDGPIEFYCFDVRTFEAIKRNEVIAETLEKIGPLKLLTDHRRSSRNEFTFYRVWMRVRAVLGMARIAALALTRRVTFIHFKGLDTFPLRLLYLLNKKRTFLVQSSAAGSSAVELQLDQMVRKRDLSRPRPAAAAMVHFTDDWQPTLDARVADVPRYKVAIPYRRAAWNRYLSTWATRFFESSGIAPGSDVVSLMCNTMSTEGLLDSSTDFYEMFRATLSILAEELPDVPVLVKRHPATTPAIIARQEEIVRSIDHKIVFTDLHPQLLAAFSRCFVGTWYSTTFLIGRLAGIPTIQYTRAASGVCAVTNGENPRPDLVSHYIDGDEVGFRALLRTLAPRGNGFSEVADRGPENERYDCALALMADSGR